METFCRYDIFITSLCWFCSCQAHFGQLQYIAQCWRNDDDLLFWVRRIFILRPHLYAHICQKFPKTQNSKKLSKFFKKIVKNSEFTFIADILKIPWTNPETPKNKILWGENGWSEIKMTDENVYSDHELKWQTQDYRYYDRFI